MTDVTATDAARRFADLLDSVEHHGQRYTVIRHGRAVAQIEPLSQGRGNDAKKVLRRHRPDGDWAGDLETLRNLIEVEDRP